MVELLTTLGERKLVRAFGMERISKRVPYTCSTVSITYSAWMCKKNGKRSPEGWKGAIQLLIGNSLIRIQTGYPVYVCSESKQDKWYRYLYRYDHINPSLDP